ncbi:hypothetical protein V493_07973 [Pseudogymnoascus sp. VKM F-4281 (FW-2241)]|nr:hypothetical protein V493_07973 [Pseudogymnoascus sp. VKM F-4281 (FW-2241)]
MITSPFGGPSTTRVSGGAGWCTSPATSIASRVVADGRHGITVDGYEIRPGSSWGADWIKGGAARTMGLGGTAQGRHKSSQGPDLVADV